MILNINQLRAFYFVAKYNSVKLAAQELMVTPPAITKQVKQLEEFLDAKLMFRESNGIKLTTMGKKAFKKSEVIFDKIRELEYFFDGISGLKAGELRIGCPPSASIHVLPGLISNFKKSYPQVKLILEHGTHSEMIQNILNRQNELAVICPNPKEKRIKTKVLWEDEIVLIAAMESDLLPADEISIPELADIPLILPKEGTATREKVFEYYHKLRQTPFIALECDSLDLIKRLVINDQGVSFIANTYVRDDIENKKLRIVRILAPPLTMLFALGYLKRDKLSPVAMAFLRLVDTLELKNNA
ncbi:MAG: LysR family transcriptional regulator [Deltaproteobacteria bacterium]|nr:LysR family transcriptional regulator [Deltaproteobacteria bacterium]